MDPTTVTVVETVGPWYVRLAEEVGPLAATLLLFLMAGGWVTWRISIAVMNAWHIESDRHRQDLTNEREQHRADIEQLVQRLDERDKFQRDELTGLVRAYEQMAASQISALEKIESVLEPINHGLLSRPCMLHEQKREILDAARAEAEQTLRNLQRSTQ